MNVGEERLLNDWQHGFPLCQRPYAQLARDVGFSEAEVMEVFCRMLGDGRISRIGGVFAPDAGGASSLVAMSVPEERIEAVAAEVSAHPGVNHNYLREHSLNLWFVMTGANSEAVESGIVALENRCDCQALRLPMLSAYHIDLGFDLRGRAVAKRPPQAHGAARLLAPAEWPLAECAERGLAVVERPYAAWGEEFGWSEAKVIASLEDWLAGGQLKRFGVVVRHHELGFVANAMTVFNVPDEEVAARGEALAGQEGVTLCYRRARAAGWPYNLYAMVHGVEREAVLGMIEAASHKAGLEPYPREILFSVRRFKQTGARRFRGWDKTDGGGVAAMTREEEVDHAFA